VKYRTGSYGVQEFGAVQVTIQPAGAVTDGATWSVDGGAVQPSGAVVGNLTVGTHTITYNTVNGWSAPATETITVTVNDTLSTTATYTAITGIEESGISSFQFYPNPANNYLNVTRDGNEKFSVKVFNVMGENIYSAEGASKFIIETSSYLAGLYYIQCSSSHETIASRFVKQ
jgi:hypothetical protein